MSKRKVTREALYNIRGHYNQPFNQSKGSIFSLRPYSYDIRNLYGVTKWELLTEFMARRFVTRYQVNRFAHRRWLAVTSMKNRLYVCELCPDAINEYLDTV